jgi:hypothetical protein
MTPQPAKIEFVTDPIDGGLIMFGHANLPANQITALRQNSMAPPDVPDNPVPTSQVAADSQIRATRPSFFLRTKLLPPRPAPELLSRPRLTDRLLANLGYPVTLVTANAGS